MAMSKYWDETWSRLDAIEAALKKLQAPPAEKPQTAVTKADLMKIQGVGSSTADKILELLNA